MIKASDAIRAARSLIGTPYAQLDCINLIKKIIRTAPGGEKAYTTAGTNTLWRSVDAAKKYRDLTWRQAGLLGAQAGMLAFKASGEDVRHVGIVTDVGTVIHSSSTQGGRGVVETPLTSREGWTHLAEHRLIAAKRKTKREGTQMNEEKTIEEKTIEAGSGERAVVSTAGGRLNVRRTPGGEVIASLENGSEVEIAGGGDGWLRVHFGESGSGYVFAAYISRRKKKRARLRITDEAGDIYDIEGAFTVRVLEDGED